VNPGGGSTEGLTHEDLARAVDALVDECRTAMLWYIRQDYQPRTAERMVQMTDETGTRSLEYDANGRLSRAAAIPSGSGSLTQNIARQVGAVIDRFAEPFLLSQASNRFGLSLGPSGKKDC
jgi:YD repeat-containing protein